MTFCVINGNLRQSMAFIVCFRLFLLSCSNDFHVNISCCVYIFTVVVTSIGHTTVSTKKVVWVVFIACCPVIVMFNNNSRMRKIVK